MNQKNIRWQQRFDNYKKALQLLEDTLSIELDRITRGALIQHFEMTIELGWKLLKDFLESQGNLAKFPREVIKQAFQNEIISDGQLWLFALEERNKTVHTYNEEQSIEITNNIINSYIPMFIELKTFLEQR